MTTDFDPDANPYDALRYLASFGMDVTRTTDEQLHNWVESIFIEPLVLIEDMIHALEEVREAANEEP